MAIPEKRVRGWWLVLVLVVVALLVAGMVVVLRPSARLGPPLLLVLAEDTIFASPADVAVLADFGPHCSDWRWDEGRGHLTVEADTPLQGVDALVLQRFTLGTTNFVRISADLLRTTVRQDGGTWRITSPVDDRPLLTLAAAEGSVVVGTATYPPGETWTMRFAYDVDTPEGTVRVTEDVTFRNVGIVFPRIVPATMCV